jgi:ankyrin repeat protein
MIQRPSICIENVIVIGMGMLIACGAAFAGHVPTDNEATARLVKLSESYDWSDLGDAVELFEIGLSSMIEAGADVDAKNASGVTVLFLASENGHTEIVRLLLEAGADASAANPDGATPLIVASQNGHIEIVRLLLEAKAEVNAAHETGATPLFAASQNGHTEIVRLLLEAGSNVNAAGPDGVASLYRASINGHLEIVRLLLEAGADASAAGSDGVTPLLAASIEGHLEIVRLLLGAKAEVNAAHETGTTPLWWASAKGHPDIARLLLKAGADANAARNADGVTPLDIAVENGHTQTIKVLKEFKADEAVDYPEMTSTQIQTAPSAVSVAILRLLIDDCKRRKFADLKASEEFPIIIEMSASEEGTVDIHDVYLDCEVTGKATVKFVDVWMQVTDADSAANEARKINPDVAVIVRDPVYHIESGRITCAGSYEVFGRQLMFLSGNAILDNNELEVSFSEGAECRMDGKPYVYTDGTWKLSEP